MDWLFALITLTAMEVVLGIDNIVFISILCGKLPADQRWFARTFGLGLAMGTRILLLLSLTWVLGLTQPIFELTSLGVPASWVETADAASVTEDVKTSVAGSQDSAASTRHEVDENSINAVSWRDLILLAGGLFLIANSVVEIHHKIDRHGQDDSQTSANSGSLWKVIIQIGVLDIIFSLDSVITAIGMTDHINIMIVAVALAILVMMVFAGMIERFIEKYPTIKVLALSFLILIGVLLVAEGIGTHVNKGYIYFAMVFSLGVELVNMQIRGGKGTLPQKHVSA